MPSITQTIAFKTPLGNSIGELFVLHCLEKHGILRGLKKNTAGRYFPIEFQSVSYMQRRFVEFEYAASQKARSCLSYPQLVTKVHITSLNPADRLHDSKLAKMKDAMEAPDYIAAARAECL
jgi:hypothetical protein